MYYRLRFNKAQNDSKPNMFETYLNPYLESIIIFPSDTDFFSLYWVQSQVWWIALWRPEFLSRSKMLSRRNEKLSFLVYQTAWKGREKTERIEKILALQTKNRYANPSFQELISIFLSIHFREKSQQCYVFLLSGNKKLIIYLTTLAKRENEEHDPH